MERRDGEDLGEEVGKQQAGVRERKRSACLPQKFLLTDCGEHWTAEVLLRPRTPPPLLAHAPLSTHCHIHSFTLLPP